MIQQPKNNITNFKIITALVFTCVLLTSCLTSTDPSKPGDPSKPATTPEPNDSPLNGLYAGLEEMCYTDSTGKRECYTDPAIPDRKWYRLGYLKIKGDSAFLDQNPITIGRKQDTMWSASDGAFYYYSGTIQREDTIILLNLKLLYCDYCAILVNVNPDGSKEIAKRTKQLKGRLAENGIVIDGYLYARTEKNKSLMSENPRQQTRE